MVQLMRASMKEREGECCAWGEERGGDREGMLMLQA